VTIIISQRWLLPYYVDTTTEKRQMTNQIEKSLAEKGWKEDGVVPLILGASLLNSITHTLRKDSGAEVIFQGVTLFHKGDRYVLQWNKWSQSTDDDGTPQENKGFHSDGATHFDPKCDAVGAGHEHVLTVSTEASTITFWKKVD